MRRLLLALLFPFLLSAADVYVAKTSAGGNTGADCADAKAYTAVTFNSAGTTYHLCGTFSMAAGSSGVITISGSGTSGNPITIKFETGAGAMAPNWGANGFIYASGQSYIVVNGGTNGYITATQTGTGLTYSDTKNHLGIRFANVSNSTIENVSISNIYVHTAGQAVSSISGTGSTVTATCSIAACGLANGATNVSIESASGTTCSAFTQTGITISSTAGNTVTYSSTLTGTATGCVISDDNGSQTSWGIRWSGGSNATIQNNTIHDAYGDIWYDYPSSRTTTNVTIANNTLYNANWTLAVGDDNTNSILNGLVVTGNTCHDWYMWYDAHNINHHDGIFVYSTHAGSLANAPWVYNNVIYGDPGPVLPDSGHIYMSGSGGSGLGTVQNDMVFNNVIYCSNNDPPADGYIYDYGVNNNYFNNTIVGCQIGRTGGNGFISYGTGVTIENTIFVNGYIANYYNGGASQLTLSNYNDFYNYSDVGRYGGIYYGTLAAWQAATGTPDLNSTSGNPNLNATSTPIYQLTNASSPAYRTGANLTNYCNGVTAAVTPLCTSAEGNTRPTTGAWDMGAYYYIGTSGTVATPTFSPNGGTYRSAQAGTISDTTPGACREHTRTRYVMLSAGRGHSTMLWTHR